MLYHMTLVDCRCTIQGVAIATSADIGVTKGDIFSLIVVKLKTAHSSRWMLSIQGMISPNVLNTKI